MSELSRGVCEPCNRDSPKLEDSEIERLLGEIPEWQRRDRNRIFQLERQFRFRTFADALTFTNKVGALAEAERHHPALLTEWGRVTVTWWTHAIGGLHKNDFIMAARTDSLYRA